MEIIGRRWTIAYALSGAFPGLVLMASAHLAGNYANVLMSAGAMVIGFTALSSFPAVRVYLSEQFPTALRGRGNIFGEAFGRIFAGVLAPFLIEPHTGSPRLLRHDRRHRVARRLHTVALRQGDGRPAGGGHRAGA